MQSKTVALVGMYLAAIVAANLLVAAYGPAVTVVNALVFIALDLSSRDALHEAWAGRGLAWKMAGLIAAGSALSYALNRAAGPIALASLIAFAASATVDALVYGALGGRPRLARMNGSNIASAAVDSVLFPLLAFGLPLLWPIVLGQLVAKVAGGALWAWLLTRRAEVAHE